MNKKYTLAAILILIFSLFIQVLLIYNLSIQSPNDAGNDQPEYYSYGIRIAAGENYYDFGMRPPVYPFILGFLFKYISDLRFVRLIQVFLHIGLCAVAYLVVSRLLCDRYGLISLFLLAFYPGFIYGNLVILSDSIFNTIVGFTFLCGICLIWTLKYNHSWRRIIINTLLFGFLSALAYMTRSVGIFVPFALGVVLILTKLKNWLIVAIGMSIVFILAVMPMLLSTHQARGYWGSPESYFWSTLNFGNNSSDNIVFVWKGIEGDQIIAESIEKCADLQRPYLTFSDCTGNLKRTVIEQIKERPLLAFLRLFGKSIDIWGPERSFAGDVRDGDFGPSSIQMVIFVALVANLFYVTSLIGGLTGLWLELKKREIVLFGVLILFLTTLGISIISFGHPRFHIPLMFILIVFAGPGLEKIFGKVITRKKNSTS